MKKIGLVIFFITLISFGLFCQERIDSLRKALLFTNSMEEKINIQNALSLQLKDINLEESFLLVRKSLEESTKIGYSKGAGVALSNLGLFHYLKNNIDSATWYNKKAISHLIPSGDSVEISKNYNRLGVDYYMAGKSDLAAENYLLAISWSNSSRLKANAFNNLGMISKHSGDFGQAITYHHEALSLYELLDDKLFLSRTYSNLAACYLLKKNYVIAEEQFLIAEKIAKELNDKECIAQALNGLGIVASKKNEYNKALNYFKESAQTYFTLNIQKEYAQQLVNLGDVFTRLLDFKQAANNYQKSISIFEKLGDKRSLSAVYNNLGNLYYQQKKNQLAINYFKKAIELADYSDEKNFKIIIAKNLSSIFEETGNTKEALAYRKLYDTYKEDVINVAENLKSIEIDKKFEVSKKENQLKVKDQQLNKLEDNRTRLILLLLFSLLFAVFLIWLIQKNKSKQLVLEQNIVSISKQIESLKTENHNLKDLLISTEKELQDLNQKYSGSKEKLPGDKVLLSKREFEVLLFIAEGLTDKEISEKIFVSINTVRTHTRRIYDKLLVNNRLEAVSLLNKYNLTGE